MENTPHVAMPQKLFPKAHPSGALPFMSVVYYRGERFFIEQSPPSWEGSGFVRITDCPLRKERETWPEERQSFSVFADLLQLVAPPPSPKAVMSNRRMPTPASVERAASGRSDAGDRAADLLRGKTQDEVYKVTAAELGVPEADLRARYGHLNPGQQRMNCGNRLRAKFKQETSQ